MAKEIKFRRGTTVQHSTFTGAEGEITVDTDKDTLVVHDGVTAGGKPLSTESTVTSGLALKANINSPVFTGTVSGVTKTMVGLSNVDNTTDLLKPISTLTQTALDLKVSKDSATGAAYLPAGTTAQRPASPVNGYMRYNSDLLAMEAYVNGSWGSVGGGATGGGTDHVFNNNGYTVTSNYTIPAGMSTVTVGDNNGNVTINSGVTVTVSSGSRWVVL